MRLEDVKTTPATPVASACPFCKTMLSDAINETKTEGVVSKDVAELLLESVG
jgi:Fe-S oxidoreductase